MSNRGVQALVFSIIRFCSEFGSFKYYILSDDIERDKLLVANMMEKYNIEFIPERNSVFFKILSRLSIYLPASLSMQLIKILSLLPFKILGIGGGNKYDFAISTGGDLYTPEYGFPLLQMIRDYKLNHQSKFMIFGASLNSFKRGEKTILQFLAAIGNLYVRESTSKDYLEQHQILAQSCYDPAFNLEYTAQPTKTNSVGLNLSPYVVKDSKYLEMFAENIIQLQNQGYHFIYLSHVYDNNNNGDRECYHKLNKLLDQKIEDHTFELDASNAKAVISTLSFIISARTHVCIAGYSTGVPTLALSYSFKSIGLNTDITQDPSFVLLPGDEMPNNIQSMKDRYPTATANLYTSTAVSKNRTIFEGFLID